MGRDIHKSILPTNRRLLNYLICYVFYVIFSVSLKKLQLHIYIYIYIYVTVKLYFVACITVCIFAYIIVSDKVTHFIRQILMITCLLRKWYLGMIASYKRWELNA
jgi:hypothetical protein